MGGAGGDASGIFEPEPEPETVERSSQRGVAVDSSEYFETGAVAVAIAEDGLPRVGGEPPETQDEGITDENLVCTSGPGRPRCKYYTALLVPADGVAKGFPDMRQIRRFCSRLQTASELWEITGSVYACTARRPRDEASNRAIEDFEARQKALAAEMNETGGKLEF